MMTLLNCKREQLQNIKYRMVLRQERKTREESITQKSVETSNQLKVKNSSTINKVCCGGCEQRDGLPSCSAISKIAKLHA